jgi:hypothetical protein
MNPTLKIRCTSCGKVAEATPDQLLNAREVGVCFSSCCMAVAVVVSAAVRTAKRKAK